MRVGLEVGEFVHTLGDAHIYLNHMEQVETVAREKKRIFNTCIKHPENQCLRI